METTHIEMLVTKLLQEMHPKLRAFVKHETMLRDTFMQRFFTSKTPLGEVFQELQNSQESPNRQLLSEKKIVAAEIEAQDLFEKFTSLELFYPSSTASASSVSVMNLEDGKFIVTWDDENQDDPAVFAQVFDENASKLGSEFRINTYAASSKMSLSVKSLEDGKFVVTLDNENQDDPGHYEQIFNADGTKNGPKQWIVDEGQMKEDKSEL